MFLPTGSDQKLKKIPFATITIILVNIAVHYHVSALGRDLQNETFRAWGWVLNDAGPVILFTSMFLHGDFFHLLGNMIFLWAFGSYLEGVVGWKRYLAYYLGGGMAATALHSIFVSIFAPSHASIPCIGASGAVSGIMGVYLVRCYFTRIKMAVSIFGPLFIPKRLKINAAALVGSYFAMDLYHGLMSIGACTSNVAHWAHVGGLLFGMVVSVKSNHLKHARLDKLRLRSKKWIEKDVGLGVAKKDLEEILENNPGDPQALIDLAARALEVMIEEAKAGPRTAGGPIIESAYVLLGRILADKLDCPEPAAHVFREFISKFPDAGQREMVTHKLRLITAR